MDILGPILAILIAAAVAYAGYRILAKRYHEEESDPMGGFLHDAEDAAGDVRDTVEDLSSRLRR